MNYTIGRVHFIRICGSAFECNTKLDFDSILSVEQDEGKKRYRFSSSLHLELHWNSPRLYV